MFIRVPLVLQKSVAVIQRLDIAATRAFNPPGPDTTGYDETFRESIAFGSTEPTRAVATQYATDVKIPCQVEDATDARLRQLGLGDSPVSSIILVFHREDLEDLGLLDANRNVTIKKSDRIMRLESFDTPGKIIKTFPDPGLFIFEMRSASWGFGPDGYDLELAILADRAAGVKP